MKGDYEKISDLAQNRFFMGYLKEKIDNFRVLMGEDVEGVDEDIIHKNKVRTHIPKRNQDLKDILVLLLKIHKAMQYEKTLEPIHELEKQSTRDKPTKTAMIKKILEETPKMSDYEISEKVECSIDLVRQVKKAKLLKDELTFKTEDLKSEDIEEEESDDG